LAKLPTQELCKSCHDLTQPKFVATHIGKLTPTTDCTGCHAPHAAPGKGLFWPNQHVPFSEQKCEECHGARK
jgi:hypothetical protein